VTAAPLPRLPATLLPGAGGLRPDERGFVVRSLFRSHRTDWQDVAGFRPIRVGLNAFVGFDLVPGTASAPRLRRANAALAGAEPPCRTTTACRSRPWPSC
jgi:hypothetical protein